jgi:histidine triad (HIT) family protein
MLMDMKNDPNCLFCKIVAGQIPCHKVYEDARVLAFLDIGPLSDGHTLIIPKAHYQQLDEMTPEDAAACMAIAPKLARAVMSATGAPGYNLLQNNGRIAHQAVMHVHFHIIPKTDRSGLGITWPAGKLGPEDAKTLIAGIVAALPT